VSGYLCIDGDRAHGYVGGGSTHAWVQVYLPSAGWIEFDPTNGIVGTRDPHPRRGGARTRARRSRCTASILARPTPLSAMEVSINVVSAGENRGGLIWRRHSGMVRQHQTSDAQLRIGES